MAIFLLAASGRLARRDPTQEHCSPHCSHFQPCHKARNPAMEGARAPPTAHRRLIGRCVRWVSPTPPARAAYCRCSLHATPACKDPNLDTRLKEILPSYAEAEINQ
ncbi:hypothetical protein KOW79_016050 [Hemibagrus wyckioides]|uniref:Uncharacterized protein n=1 Tax=Hemibagrus wyckioides TaxID=337641 RepID=A0A9D3SDJ7_9TELE|nr:hypothetical protein KOW79_016050 [Hemibagrus wyckioides]